MLVQPTLNKTEHPDNTVGVEIALYVYTYLPQTGQDTPSFCVNVKA